MRRVLRFLIGAILALTAMGKLLDVGGFARVIGTYRVFPDAALLPLALLVPAAELLLAAWLFSGWRSFGAAVGALGMHLVYAGWTASAVVQGLQVPNCGCFGVFLPRPLGWGTVAEDLAMAVLCAWLGALSRPRRALSGDPVPA